MYEQPHRSIRSWKKKFADALRGVKAGVRGQSSFFVHFLATAAVAVAGFVFQVSRVEWCVLALAVALVMAAEMFNSALESLARSVTTNYDRDIGRALDIGSAAVLVTAAGSVIVGLLIFGPKLWALMAV